MPTFDINLFLDKFIDSLTNVGQSYYLVPTQYEPDGISRERVFCYELYHQMRLIFNDDFEYALHGELDKSGHISFPRHLQTIPDFLVHRPGTNDGNNVIIEVKGVFSPRNIFLDFNKISQYLTNENIHYQYGVFLLYNFDLTFFISRFPFRFVNSIPRDLDERVFIITTSMSNDVHCISLGEFRRRVNDVSNK